MICELDRDKTEGAESWEMSNLEDEAQDVRVAERPARPSVVRATGFELVDARGACRLKLALTGKGLPRLEMYDGQGSPRLAVGLKADGAPAMVLLGSKGRRRCEIALDEEDGTLVVYDEDGEEVGCVG